MEIYIARHGQTDWNVQHKMQGRSAADIALNDIGIKQAEILRHKTKDLVFTICYASPLKRAQETAQIVTANKCPIVSDEKITQRSFGNYDGRIITNWVETTGIDIGNLQLNTGAGNIEPVKDVLTRTKSFLNQLKKRHADNETILIITHGQIVRALHYNLVGYTEETNWWDIEYSNAEIHQYKL